MNNILKLKKKHLPSSFELRSFYLYSRQVYVTGCAPCLFVKHNQRNLRRRF